MVFFFLSKRLLTISASPPEIFSYRVPTILFRQFRQQLSILPDMSPLPFNNGDYYTIMIIINSRISIKPQYQKPIGRPTSSSHRLCGRIIVKLLFVKKIPWSLDLRRTASVQTFRADYPTGNNRNYLFESFSSGQLPVSLGPPASWTQTSSTRGSTTAPQ